MMESGNRLDFYVRIIHPKTSHEGTVRVRFRRVLIGLIAIPAFAAPAAAGEVSALDRPPVFTWTGFYGGEMGGHTFTGKTDHPDGVFGAMANAAGSAFDAASGSAMRTSLGGGQFGFNYQIQNFVFGLETDLNYTNYATPSSPAALTNGGLTDSVAYTSGVGAHWLSTIRGRFGTSIDRLLIYGTGGLAIAGRNLNNGAVILSPNGQDYAIGTAAHTASGIAIGGGLEYALTNNWTLKGEYLYTDLGPGRTFGSSGAVVSGGLANRQNELDERVIRAAINYKFDWFSAPATK